VHAQAPRRRVHLRHPQGGVDPVEAGVRDVQRRQARDLQAGPGRRCRQRAHRPGQQDAGPQPSHLLARLEQLAREPARRCDDRPGHGSAQEAPPVQGAAPGSTGARGPDRRARRAQEQPQGAHPGERRGLDHQQHRQGAGLRVGQGRSPAEHGEGHQDGCAEDEAASGETASSAPTTPDSTSTPASSTGLSAVPSSAMAARSTDPGTTSMTRAPTDSTSDGAPASSPATSSVVPSATAVASTPDRAPRRCPTWLAASGRRIARA
jgi:hypothetical protein